MCTRIFFASSPAHCGGTERMARIDHPVGTIVLEHYPAYALYQKSGKFIDDISDTMLKIVF